MRGFLSEIRSSRPMQTAVAASLVWHLIWLFVIFIDVRGTAGKPRLEPKIYFVGPILSDDAFNMILATKPEFSTTVYRSNPIAPQTLEPQTPAMDRPEPGDLVSVPLGRSTWALLRGVFKDEKPYPDTLFQKKFQVEIVSQPFPLEGELEGREMLSVPDPPVLPEPGDTPRIDPEYELRVSADGVVVEVRQTISSGDPQTDKLWERNLKQWLFMPLDDPSAVTLQTGKIRTAGSSRKD